MLSSNNNQSSGKWWQKGIIYQIYPRSFKDENNDGIGDLEGIISKLDYLKWLGVDAIWLSPHYPSPMEDFGYDVSDYTGVHEMFGTLEDMDELIEKAHKLGLRIILDYVPNHSSAEHPWFKESQSSRDNPKRDWYVWQDAKEDGSPPNNWICVPGGSAWEWDEQTKQYYLHSFLPCQPDLNWRNPELRKAMLDVLRFWLDRGVDGFRIDMISWLMKDPEFRDDPSNPEYDPKTHFYEFRKLNHVYSKDGPGLFDLLREFRQLLDEYGEDRIYIGEMDYYLPLETMQQYYENGIHLPANFRFIYLPWEAASIKGFLHSYEKTSPSYANYQLGNHDQSRIASRITREQARIAAMMLLTLRGTPFIYYGEELGMCDVPIPADQMQDPWEKTEPGKGRDPVRTPMQWSSAPNAGFSNVKPWLPVADDFDKFNVENEQKEPKSFLNLYQKLISLRKENLALSLGSYRSENDVPKDCFVYYRQYGKERFIIALNFTDKQQEITLPSLKGGYIILSTHLDREEPLKSNTVTIRRNEGCVITILEV
ncbi:MAG: alpha-amylase family glycosyl hydrolase [Promethearchaeota archaeon]